MSTTSDGVTFRVKCRPNATATNVRGIQAGALRVDVAAPPDQGKANDTLLKWLAINLSISPSNLRISGGAGSREKSIRVLGITKGDAEQRLAALLTEPGDLR